MLILTDHCRPQRPCTTHGPHASSASRPCNAHSRGAGTAVQSNPFFGHRRGDAPCHCRPLAAAPPTEKCSALCGVRNYAELIQRPRLKCP